MCNGIVIHRAPIERTRVFANHTPRYKRKQHASMIFTCCVKFHTCWSLGKSCLHTCQLSNFRNRNKWEKRLQKASILNLLYFSTYKFLQKGDMWEMSLSFFTSKWGMSPQKRNSWQVCVYFDCRKDRNTPTEAKCRDQDGTGSGISALYLYLQLTSRTVCYQAAIDVLLW